MSAIFHLLSESPAAPGPRLFAETALGPNLVVYTLYESFRHRSCTMADGSDDGEEKAGANVENVFIRKSPAFTDANGKKIPDPFDKPREIRSPLAGAKLVRGPQSMFGMGM